MSENKAVDQMISYSASIVGEKVTRNELDIANEIARNVILGNLHKVFVENATREQRKRLVGIAFNLIEKKRRLLGCGDCSICQKTCCKNEILQRRFAEEMFQGMEVY